MLKIVFMGTPDFAVPCLERLIDEKYTISAVFSQPDRPRGRGHKLQATAVKTAALAHGIPVYQPTKMKDGTVLKQLEELAPDVLVVVAYGRILPKEILAVPRLGAVNVHGSLLPKYRGAAPIQWSVINGDAETGITTILLDEGMDTGPILLQDRTPIGKTETSGRLFARLSALGADTLIRTLEGLGAGTITPTPQDHSKASHAPMITKEMAALDFTKSPREVCQLIYGLHPWPKAYTMLEGERLAILAANPVDGYQGKPGEIIDPKEMIVACGTGAIALVSVQPAGRPAMDAADFANGRHLQGGETLMIP